MNPLSLSHRQTWIVLGDAVLLAAITLIGLLDHQTLGAGRFLLNFVPALLAWLLVAWPLAAFEETTIANLRRLWRPVLAMVFAAPLSALLRALWLGSDTIIVIFVLVLGGLSTAAILAWRAIAAFLLGRRDSRYG